MFGKVRSERSFSLCLAEELLRAELRKHFGDEVKIFQMNMVATKPIKQFPQPVTLTDLEINQSWSKHWERYITMVGRFGPVGRLYPDNPPEDLRGRIFLIEAKCRLFSIESGCVMWRPHFMRYTITTDEGFNHAQVVRLYEDGRVYGGRLTMLVPDNPCHVMVASQGPRGYVPDDWTPRIKN
ncbi:hypothetical protein HYV69_03030 [Candidatus Uhrbacteria bacterium]|nr:hypothetical protein [Candidatus Uhrbacteria bacterium]